jgi:FAD/FMN-containing dehydrogenase
LSRKKNVIVYEQDMLEVVMLPADVEQVAAVVKAARRVAVPIGPCGSGIGVAGRSLEIDQSNWLIHFSSRTMLKIVPRLQCKTNNTFLLTGVSYRL